MPLKSEHTRSLMSYGAGQLAAPARQRALLDRGNCSMVCSRPQGAEPLLACSVLPQLELMGQIAGAAASEGALPELSILSKTSQQELGRVALAQIFCAAGTHVRMLPVLRHDEFLSCGNFII